MNKPAKNSRRESLHSERLAHIIHDGSERNGGVARDKRKDRLVSLVYLVCLVEPDRRDEPNQPSLVVLFPPVSPVTLKSEIDNCGSNTHASDTLVGCANDEPYGTVPCSPFSFSCST